MLALFKIMHMQKVLIGCKKTKKMSINICSDVLDGKKYAMLKCTGVEIGMEMLSNCMKNKNENVHNSHIFYNSKKSYIQSVHTQ